MSEVKIYPGSDKGPNPEDDIENYSRWFIENQPKSIYDGSQADYSDLGVKKKYVEVVRDQSDNIEHKNMINWFQNDEELYPLQNYHGIPEFAIFDREQYNVEDDDQLPELALTSNMGVNELHPLPTKYTNNYQELHPELERWTIFRGLPMMMKYDQALSQFFKGIQQGTLRIPDFVNTINPPSLWAYYETLPRWARDHPVVRNAVIAFEYYKPITTIRQKEIAMNYAVSFIRPIHKDLEDVIVEVATSQKVRLNIAKGKEMLNQLKFYEFDSMYLGETSHDEAMPFVPGEGENPGQSALAGGIDEEDDELQRQRSAMEKFASGLDDDHRERVKSKIMEEELNITDYQVEPEMEKVMTDFYVKPYHHPLDPVDKYDPLLPLHYYDNDDGFWTEYIQMKQNKWAANPMIVNRPFLKH